MTRGEGGRGWISVKEHSLSDYLKRADVNSDKVLNVFVKKQELIAEQKKMRLDEWMLWPTTEQSVLVNSCWLQSGYFTKR